MATVQVGAVNIAIGATTVEFEAAFKRAEAKISQSTREINSQLVQVNRAGNKLNNEFQAGFGKTGRAMADFGKSLSMSLTVPIAAAALGVGMFYQETSKLEAGITAVERSAFVAKGTLGQLVDVAKLPGLGIAEANQFYLGLRNVNVEGETAIRTIKALGNAVASGGGGKAELGSLATQIPQLIAKNKVTAEDLKPIINAAPQVAQALMKLYGTVSSEEIQKKLEATGKGARVFMAELVAELEKLPKVANSFNNSIETFGDSLKIAGGEIGKVADEAFGLTSIIDTTGTAIANTAKDFGEAPKSVQQLTLSLVGAAAAFPLVITAAGTLMTTLGTPWNAGMNAARSAWVGFTGVIAANPLIAASVAVAALSYGLVKYADATSIEIDQQEIMNNVRAKGIELVQSEITNVNQLFAVAKNDKISKEERQIAIQKLNEISPQYLKNLSLEKIGTDEASKAVKEYIGYLNLKGEAQAIAGRLQEIQNRNLQLNTRSVTEQNGILDDAVALFGSMGQVGGFAFNRIERGAALTRTELIRNQKEADMLQQRLTKLYEGGKLKPSDITAAGFGGDIANPLSESELEKLRKLAEKQIELVEKTINETDKLKIQAIENDQERAIKMHMWEFEQAMAAKTREYEQAKKPLDEAYFEWYKQKVLALQNDIAGERGLNFKIDEIKGKSPMELLIGGSTATTNLGDKYDIGSFVPKMQEVSVAVATANAQIRDSFKNMAAEGILSIGALVGEMITGQATIQDLANSISGMIASVLMDVAKTKIALGITTLNPAFLAQGLLAAIGGGIFSGIAKRNQRTSQPRTTYGNYAPSAGGFVPVVRVQGTLTGYGSTLQSTVTQGKKNIRSRT